MPKRIRKRPRSGRPRDHYQPTPIAGLVLYPTVLLLNLIVRSAEDNAKTDGRIPAETVDVVTALIRNTYNFPDLDLVQGKGVVISFVGQFFHPDDYEEHRIAEMHRRGLLDSLQGDLGPQPLKVPKLRTSNVRDPDALSQGREKTLAIWYKQRFFSICFAGEKAQLDRLRGAIPAELLKQMLGVIWQGMDISQEAFVLPYPSFVPVPRLRKASQQNAVEWAEQMEQLMGDVSDLGKTAELTVVGPPGPTYTVRPQKR
ncbi:MAG TPA: hypothetical protein VM537_09545 [Anaerolineae bacterium]|nr:hypothetical protein [Anaerolineae bacterium]